MAHIRTHNTTQRQARSGKPVKRYEVIWREQARDTNGLPTRAWRARQESYATRAQAEARRDELNAAKHTPTGTTALADQRKAGARTFGQYAAAWLDTQRTRVATGALKQSTYDKYTHSVCHYALPRFGDRAIGAITPEDCDAFRADLASRLSRGTVNNVWRAFRAVLRHAYRRNAIPAVPTDVIDTTTTSAHATDADTRHHPLSGPQVAALAAEVGKRTHPVYELLVLFMAYSGLRQAETQGLEVRDVTLTTGPDGTTRASVRVQRTKSRRNAEWHTGTPKSARSKRTVPLPPWLAARMADYLANTHPHAGEPQAPLWPRRLPGGARQSGQQAAVRLDWSEPCNLQGLQAKAIRPALEAVGLPASRPDGTKGVRLHDFRHTFAALQLTAGVHFMQVSKWLGHASYVITLTVYADYIPEEDTGNTLPEPVAAVPKTNVVPLRSTAQGR